MKFRLVETVSDFNEMKKSLNKYEGRLPFRYDSEYSSYIDQLYAKAVNKLKKKFSNLFIEPSIQLGSGSIMATFKYNGEKCEAEWSYEAESAEINDLIVNSKSEAEFIKNLANYIETQLLDDYVEDPDSSDSVIIPASKTYLEGYLDSDATDEFIKAKHVKLEEGITSLGPNCFNSFKKLESIDLPDTLEYIGYYAFAHCRKLVSIRIPDSVTRIGMGLFYDCENLRDVIMSEGVTKLSEDWYFKGCSNLKAIMIPDSVTSMNDEMFSSCPDVIIYCNPNSYAHQYAIKHNLATRFYEDVVNDAESSISESFFDKSLNKASNYENMNNLNIPAPYDKYFEVTRVEYDEDDDYSYKLGDIVDGATILADVVAKDKWADQFDSIYSFIDDPQFPIVEIVHDRLFPVDLPSDLDEKLTEKFKTDSTNKELNSIGTILAKRFYTTYPSAVICCDDNENGRVIIMHDNVHQKDAIKRSCDNILSMMRVSPKNTREVYSSKENGTYAIVYSGISKVEVERTRVSTLSPQQQRYSALMMEAFSDNFESRELYDTGELISALRSLVKEYGHMELEKEVYLETVENDHGRQLKIGFNVAESLTEEVKNPVVPEPYSKYLEIIPETELDIDWHAKECSYDIAREIAQGAKRALGLPAHEVEMLEHDINNLRSSEWVEQFCKLPIKSKTRALFFKYAVERDEYGAGDTVSGATILGTLGPKNGYEDIFDSWYFLVDDPDFPVVEIVHDRLYPVELPELKEDVFQDLSKKISEIDDNARKYIYDRLTDYYMSDEPEADRKKVTEAIFTKLKASYREMFDFIPYWGGGEEAANKMWDEGVDERITELIGYENFPEDVINDVVIDCGYIIPDND